MSTTSARMYITSGECTTTTVNGDLIYGATVSQNGGGAGNIALVGTGYTQRQQLGQSGSFALTTEDQVQGTARRYRRDIYLQQWQRQLEYVPSRLERPVRHRPLVQGGSLLLLGVEQ